MTDRRTNEQTDIGEYRVTFVTENGDFVRF